MASHSRLPGACASSGACNPRHCLEVCRLQLQCILSHCMAPDNTEQSSSAQGMRLWQDTLDGKGRQAHCHTRPAQHVMCYTAVHKQCTAAQGVRGWALACGFPYRGRHRQDKHSMVPAPLWCQAMQLCAGCTLVDPGLWLPGWEGQPLNSSTQAASASCDTRHAGPRHAS